MKKIFSLFATMICFCLAFTGCYDDNSINVYVPDGAPALSVSEMLYTNEQFNENVTYNVVSANEIANTILQQTADIAIIPTNIASKLCGDGKTYKAVGICTFGNLYVIGKNDITSLNELTGETVGCIQIQNVPGLTFQYILKNNQINYTLDENEANANNVLLKGIEGTDVVAQLKTNKISYAVVAEPLCATALSKFENNEIVKVFDLQKLYGTNYYPQSLLVVKNSLIENNLTFVKNFINKMQNNKNWTNENVDKCVEAISNNLKTGATPSFTNNNFNSEVLNNCNIGFISAFENKDFIENYLNNLKSIEENAVGNLSSEFWFYYE